MSKKGFKKFGSAIKKFSKSKVGKVLGVAAGIGAGAVGVGLGVKAIKVARLAKGIQRGSEKKGLLKGLFGKKSKTDLDQKDKDQLLTGSTKRLARKFRKKAAKNKQEKAQLDEVASIVKDELGNPEVPKEVKEEIRENIAGTDFGQAVKQAPDYSDFVSNKGRDFDEDDVIDIKRGQGMSTGAKVGLGIGAAAASYGLAKAFGIVK